MRVARLTLEDVLAKNYDNISHLDIDIKQLVDHLQPEFKPQMHCFKGQSYRTIDDSKLSPSRVSRRTPERFGRFGSFNSEIKHKRKGSYNHQIISTKRKTQTQTTTIKHINSQSNEKKLHRFLFQMELPAINPEEKSRKTKFAIIPTTPLCTQHEPIRHLKKYENEQLPNYIKVHLDEDAVYSSRASGELVRKSQSVIKIRKKSKIPPLPSSKVDLPIKDDIGLRPYVSQLMVVDLKNRHGQRKVKTSQRHLNRKIKSSIKKSQQNIQTNGGICGWMVQQ